MQGPSEITGAGQRARSSVSLATAVLAVVALLFAALATLVPREEARALSCGPPGPRVVVGESDAVVVARRVAHLRRTPSDGVFPARSTDRYVVEEWLVGEGPRRIVVTQFTDEQPSDVAVGLALSHEKGRRFEVPLCIPVYAPDTVRSAVAPPEDPTGEGPPALFVGMGDEFAADSSHGVWLDQAGRLIARDAGNTAGFAVCPGGRLGVQLLWGPPYRAVEVLVRDLRTLETIERFRYRTDEVTGDLACRDDRADDIILATSDGIVHARDGSFLVKRRYYEDHQTVHSTSPLFGREFAVGLREDASLEAVRLSDGRIWRVLASEDGKTVDFDLDPAGERIAVLVRHEASGRDEIVVKELGSPPPASTSARVRVMSTVVGAPPLAIVSGSGDVLVDDLRFLEPAELTLPPGEYTLAIADPSTERTRYVADSASAMSDVLTELDPVHLDPGARRSLFILGQVGESAPASGDDQRPSVTLELEGVVDAGGPELAAADSYAVRVLNGSAQQATVRVGRGRDGHAFKALSPRSLSEWAEVEPPSGGHMPKAKLLKPRGRFVQEQMIPVPVPGDRFTVVMTDRVSGRGGCSRERLACLVEVIADGPFLPVGGRELVRGAAPSTPRRDAHVAWVDEERIAHFAIQRPRPDDPDRGRVTILDADDLSVLCEWRGWNQPPDAAVDGVLLAAEWPSRLVAADAWGGEKMTVQNGDAYPRPVVPLPHFDGASLLGEQDSCVTKPSAG